MTEGRPRELDGRADCLQIERRKVTSGWVLSPA
jgi:hypothetical protein